MPDLTESRPEAGPVRLTIPASVANDLDGLQETLVDLAGRIGCRYCHSGRDPLYLKTANEYTLGDDGLEPEPSPWIEGLATGRNVDVLVPDSVTHDIELLKRAVAITVGKLGCLACCSGFDITFRRESAVLALTEQEVRGSE